MTRVAIDEALRAKLHNLTTPLELCDDKGNVLAILWPTPTPSIYVGRECPLSPEEIEDRVKNPGRLYTGEEIDALLEKR